MGQVFIGQMELSQVEHRMLFTGASASSVSPALQPVYVPAAEGKPLEPEANRLSQLKGWRYRGIGGTDGH